MADRISPPVRADPTGADPGRGDPVRADRGGAEGAGTRSGSAPSPAVPPLRRPWPWLLSALLFALLLGLIASPWAERQLRQHLPLALADEAAAQRDPRVDGLLARIEQLEARLAEDGSPIAAQADAAALATRVAALESGVVAFGSSDAANAARLEQLEAALARTDASMAAGDAQLRDLFLLTVTRRLFDAGRLLAPVEGALTERYRNLDGAAVEALVAWSAAPQTWATLAARLPDLAGDAPASATSSWWERLKSRLSGLVTVQDPGAVPVRNREEAVAAAREAMLAGDLPLATTTLGATARTPAIAAWVADAGRVLAADEALSRLEARAVEGGVAANATAPEPARATPPVNAALAAGGAAPPP